MPDRARLAAHSAGQQNEFKTLTTCYGQPWDETQDRGVATFTKLGAVMWHSHSYNFSLDNPSEGGSPPEKNVNEKLFNRWDGGCPTPYAILFA